MANPTYEGLPYFRDFGTKHTQFGEIFITVNSSEAQLRRVDSPGLHRTSTTLRS
jgi:hypothetical protein